MEKLGILQEIREELTQGASTSELTANGYAAGSIRKANRQLRSVASTARRSLLNRGPIPIWEGYRDLDFLNHIIGTELRERI